jgi:hypothetical protein
VFHLSAWLRTQRFCAILAKQLYSISEKSGCKERLELILHNKPGCGSSLGKEKLYEFDLVFQKIELKKATMLI